MSKLPNELLDTALGAPSPAERREAFITLLRSDEWRLVLAPHVISSQGYRVRDTLHPDWATFHQAAEAVAVDPEKVQRSLELAGSRFSASLLAALAKNMGRGLVAPALEELSDAEGLRATILLHVLQQADADWLQHPLAPDVVRAQLRAQDTARSELMHWLARAGVLENYVDTLHEYPPSTMEDWGALGRAGLRDPSLYDLAMSTLPHVPSPILYLMRLDPLPREALQRIMASARPDWIASALELAILDTLHTPDLLPLAEMGVRVGGRAMAAATAWIGASKLARQLLVYIGQAMKKRSPTKLQEDLWVRRKAASPDRALERGRRGERPDLMDAAALVRQLRGDKVHELVREILSEPRPEMLETVLRPLCAVNEQAAREVMSLCESSDRDVAKRASAARLWSDIAWPPEDSTQRIELTEPII